MASLRSAARIVAIVFLSACPSNTVLVRKSPGSTLCDDTRYACCSPNEPADDVNDHERSNSRGPMVVFSPGCSGSSAMIKMVLEFAESVNESIYNCGCSYELIRDIADGKYGGQDETMTDKVRAFVEFANNTQRRLLFKHELKFALTDPHLMKYLVKVGAGFVNFRRSNKLDVALCDVHDCFLSSTPKPLGYGIDRHGKEVKHCEFRGRGSTQTTEAPKVFFNTDNLVENLRHMMRVEHETTEYLKTSGSSFSSATYETLFRFHKAGDEGIRTSAAAWKEVMSAFGVELKESSIRTILKMRQHEHEPPQPHATIISNYHDVKATLASCTDDDCEEMRSWLRGSASFSLIK